MSSEFRAKIDAFVESYPGFAGIHDDPGKKRIAADALARAIEAYTFEGSAPIDISIHARDLVSWLDRIKAPRLPGNLHYRDTEGDPCDLDSLVREESFESILDTEWSISRDIEDRYYSLLENEGLYHLVADLKEQDDLRFSLSDEGITDFPITINDDIWRCNILLAHGDEANSDFSNTWVLGSMLDGVRENDPDCVHDCALSWLVHQQGYTLKDLVEGKSSPFLDSVRQEIDNASSSMSALTFCVRLNREELESMLDPSHNIRIDRSVMVGLFDAWSGGGSVLEIELEKDVILDSRMIHTIQVEGAETYGQHNVDSVYGLVSRAWRRAYTATDEAVSFPGEEEKRADLEALRAHCEAQDNSPGCS